MNRKTTLAFSIISTVALVSLIAFAPIVETHQAHAFWGGYYGGWGWHHGWWGWHHGSGW